MITSELKRLHFQLGTWPAVADDVGASDRRLRDIVRIPGEGARVDKRLREDTRLAYLRKNPFPLPEYMLYARDELVVLKAWPGSAELRRRIIEVEGMLARHSPDSVWDDASRDYLLGFTATSRATHHHNQDNWFGGRKGWKSAIEEAEAFHWKGHQKIVHALSAPLPRTDQEILRRLDQALYNNWLCAVGEQMKFGRSRVEVRNILEKAQALESLKQFLEDNSYLWQAAANGLEIASSIESSDEWMLYFYNKLKEIDPGFQSFDYSPGEIPALSAEPELANFCARFRNELHIDNPPPARSTRSALVTKE
jgi:hypothetical protein